MGKGQNTEREIAVALSEWWTSGERQDIFWRSSQSGGRATQRRKQNKSTHNSASDISYIDEIGKPLIDFAIIEIKRGYNKLLDLLSVIDGKKTNKPIVLLEWFEKAKREAKENNRPCVIIIIRRDYKEYCVLIDYISALDIQYCANKSPKNFITYKNEFLLLSFKEFLSWCRPQYVKEILLKKFHLNTQI